QEKLPGSQIGLEIEIPSEITKNAYERVIQKYTRTANIPGFRKGKVPRQILIQRMGKNYLKAMALDEAIQDGLRKVKEREDIQAIGQFELISEFDDLLKVFEPGKELPLSAKVDVPPEAEIDNYVGLEIKAEEVPYDPAKVDEYLEARRVELATLVPVEGRPAQENNVVLIDYSAKFAPQEGEEKGETIFDTIKDYELELKQGSFIPGFIEGIVGMSTDETKEFEADFPKDYGNEELAGEKAIFTVTMKEIKEKELPELEDEFAEEISEFETLAELRESLEKDYRKKAEEQTELNKEIAVVDELVKVLKVELPQTTIEDEISKIVTQRAIELGQYGLDVSKMLTQEVVAKMRANSREAAIEQLKVDLALKEVAKRESITVDESEIEEEAIKVKKELEGQTLDEDKLYEVLKDNLTEKKTIKWLVERAKVELVPEGSLKAQEEQEEVEAEVDGGAIEVEATTVEETAASGDSPTEETTPNN
ncbi:MAG: trigger factor, partial [Okeania sp. SIO2H7]|nr:trigger factor [Okeania sp. SIO2H7]